MGVWGKVFGGFAGFAVGGPLGALFGAAAGHAVDRMRDDAADSPPERPRLGASSDIFHSSREAAFSVAVIVLGAKLAKADGTVSRAEVDAFKQVFRVPPGEVRNVARIFDAAKGDAKGFEPYARQVALLFRREPAVLDELLGGLFHIARADGAVNATELAFLRRVGDIFGFDAARFAQVRNRFLPAQTRDAYAILGIARTASDDAVKKAYRRLIRENHPDTLVARGLPREMLAQANEKMAVINAAYDDIAKQRGLT
ncbi:MAG: TerB family tellurite resistance protein [Rhodospirillales bacterium]